MTLHKDFPAGIRSSHPPGYVQSSDPGAVGADKVWIDTSGGTGAYVYKIRNAADTGWETLSASAGAIALDDLTDVVITTPATGHILRHDGTHFVNQLGIAPSDVTGTAVVTADSRLSDARTPTAHSHAASDISSGVIAIARLATGTPDGTKFVRDDGVLATPAGGGASGLVNIFQNRTLSSRVSIASNSAFNIGSPSKFTVRMRVMLSSDSAFNNGLATRSSLSNDQGDWALGFFNGSNRAPTFRVNGNAASIQSGTVLSVGVLYYLEASYDSSLGSNNLKLFINGLLDTQGTYTTVISNNANPIHIGDYYDAAHGVIAYISDFEFCAGVVRNTANYTPTLITPDANTTVHLPLYWATTDTITTGLTDDSGNSFNGTLTGDGPQGFDQVFRQV